MRGVRSVDIGSVFAAHRKSLSVRCVPGAEVNLGILKVCKRESSRSKLTRQEPLKSPVFIRKLEIVTGGRTGYKTNMGMLLRSC